jgi:8-oxo-dGTP diphosphatase
MKDAQEQKPRVGVGIMILRGGKILLAKRLGSHGAGEYAFPGGHLEYMESFEECACRELAEEVGIEIKNIKFLFLANVKRYAPKHYCHIGLVAEWKSGEPKILEPDKSEEWQWFDIHNLPEPMFEMCKLSVDSFLTGRNYYDNR